MKKFFAILTLCILFLLPFSAIASASLFSSTITYTIDSKDNKAEIGGYLISCEHFYSVSVNGQQIIPPTKFPDNAKTVIELPKTKDNYTISFYDLRTYTHSVSPLAPLSLDHVFKGNASQEIVFTAGFLWGGGHGIQHPFSMLGVVKNIITSKASAGTGETSTTVPVAVVAAVLGAAAAAGVAGAAGGAKGSNESEEQDENGSTYKMCINKDFGDKIKYNGETLFIYARMVEINSEGAEIERPDLTQQISIFSSDSFLTVSPAVFQGDYMGSSLDAYAENTATMPKEATICFKFNGEGGSFQNNVKFQMVGECYIEIEGGKLFVLATSGQSFEQPYKLVDFFAEAEVMVNKWQDNSPFDLTIGKDKDGNTVLVATDHAEKKPFESFFDSYDCEIIAKNEKEYARTVFSVVMCYEGVLPDFLGKPKEICAYKDEDEKMKETLIAFRLGVWNDTTKRLEFVKPETIDIECSDEDGIFAVIGLDFELDPDAPSDDSLRYIFKAEKNLPSLEKISGTLSAACTLGAKSYANETKISLIPDVQQYEKDFEKEYQNCLKIINTYMPERFRAKKIQELEKSKQHLGLEDLKIFRTNAWQFASRCIMQDKESYLIDSYWYDEAIATAEFAVYIGDTALDIALAPFGGPIAGFVVGQVKGSLVDLIAMRIEKGKFGFEEVWDFMGNRFQQMAGQADGLFEVPSAEKPKLLAAWLACYTIYRIAYHWWFDVEDDGTPKGIADAIENGVLDFAGKGASVVLGEFTKSIAKQKGWDKFSIADKDQQITNDAVTKAAKAGFDMADKAASQLDARIADAVKTLLDFLEKIKSGVFSA